jgi:hypothetical protein
MTPRLASTWLVLTLALLLAGCQIEPGRPGRPSPTPTPTGPVRLGTVTETAGSVTVNNRPIQGSVALNDGDKVTTGPTGRAHVELTGRGTVELEPGTDPWFIREGACVVVRILFGGALVSGTGLCVEDEPGTRVALNSAIHVEVTKGRTRITVVEGTVQLQRVARVPTQEALTQLQRVTVVSGRIQQRVVVPRAEIEPLRQRLRVVPRVSPQTPIVR